jgi:hypothetical protein
MIPRYPRLNINFLWVLAAATGLAENWLLRSYGLNTAQRAVVVSGFLPLIILLALLCVFQQNAAPRK